MIDIAYFISGGMVADQDDFEADGWFGVNYIAKDGDVDTDLPMEEYCGMSKFLTCSN
jgi:hypothetical protein